ncbi:hypothetical protein CVT25_008347 [Psilocybe cyanescens]|uniref:Cytochrome P450 n=1 Tax=Psilocybe cyanescens TaxID=93625 RepID=A0A409WV95_PSICY|nr:hypothetical protein CVT25_008347 [Psilocybe cyanescens]
MLGTDLLNTGQFVWSFGFAFAIFAVYKLAVLVYDELSSPLRDLPGPPSRSFIFGNMKELGFADFGNPSILEKWEDQYGSTIKYKWFFGTTILYTTDLKAMNHVLVNNYEFLKPPANIYIFKRVLGDGLVFADGEAHKKQVKVFVINRNKCADVSHTTEKASGFAPQQIREITGLFVAKAIEVNTLTYITQTSLRDLWADRINQRGTEEPESVDALSWFSRLALDIIGVAGFDYNFNALVDDPSKNELGNAFAITSNIEDRINMIGFIKFVFPSLSFLPGDADPIGKKAADTLFRIAAGLLEKSKAAIRQAGNETSLKSRDILTLLVRANEMDNLPESQKLSDKEVIAQIPTFLVAGHETTAISLSWTFFALTQNKNAQNKLRKELSKVATDDPTMDELNNLPYLDYVVREALRLYGPFPATMRLVGQDTIVPLGEPVTDRNGVVHHEIRLQKGHRVVIPMVVVNRAKSIWGEDASEFRPERWESIPEVASNIPGIWGNNMVFIGGPRACIGWRFAVVEMKAAVFTLIRAFDFELAVPVKDIGIQSSIRRPVLKTETDRKKMDQMPLLFIYDEATSPLRGLPGPKNPSFIFGNVRDIWNSTDSAIYEQWVEQYGSTIQYMGPAGLRRLYTTDLKAVNHVLVNSYDYPKPESAIYNIRRILGEGVLLVEGDVHKQQNPAFGPQQIRELTEIFLDKAIQLRDIWTTEIKRQNVEGAGRIDALSWLSRLTLDVIGLAGFNYKFHALTDDPELNELSKAFAILFKAGTKLDVIGIMRGIFPLLRFLPADRDAEAKQASKTMFRVGSELLEKTKAGIKKENSDKKAWAARDLLSILVRANAMPDIPENQRLTDKDVLAQIPTFLVAGHETTSIATTWALYALTQNKEAQVTLRDEIQRVSTDNPTMDELNGLPYLDAVVRETLRIHAPVPATIRVATKDDILPLNVPYTDKAGTKHYEVEIRKGQTVIIPITLINRSKSLWGEDAAFFKPERWYNIPENVAAIPGVWGNTLSFLGGPRACIGYRFALAEMKALLFILVRAFEFDLAVPASDIQKKSVVVTRPVLASDPEKSNQMPLIVRPVVL